MHSIGLFYLRFTDVVFCFTNIFSPLEDAPELPLSGFENHPKPLVAPGRLYLLMLKIEPASVAVLLPFEFEVSEHGLGDFKEKQKGGNTDINTSRWK